MITREQLIELYNELSHHFGLSPDKLTLGIGGFALTGGYSVATIMDAGYNIGFQARQLCGSGPLTDDVIETQFEQLVDCIRQSIPGFSGKRIDEDETIHFMNIERALTKHRDTVLRVARELWELFPQIYVRYGQDHPGLTPEQFFGSCTEGPAFIRANLLPAPTTA